MPRVLVLFAALLFGTTGTAQALGPDASPLVVGAARTAVGALCLLLVARVLGPTRHRIPWPTGTVAAAAAGIAGYQLTFFAAVADTGVAVGTVVAIGSAPALAGLLARVVDGTPLGARWAACTVCHRRRRAPRPRRPRRRGLTDRCRARPGCRGVLRRIHRRRQAAAGAVILGERPGALAVAGGSLVLAGLVALSLPGRRRTTEQDLGEDVTVAAATVDPG